MPAVIELERERQHRLQADNAVRRALHRHTLALLIVGRVVAGDCVDRAVLQPFDHRLAVGLAPERRRHLGESAVVADIVIGKREVVRGDLAGDRQPGTLGATDRIYSAGGRNVGHVVAPAGELHQANVPLDDHDLRFVGDARQAEPGRDLSLGHAAAACQGEVFGVLAHDQVEGARVAERAAHHLAVGNRQTVVGEADRAGLRKHAHLGELPSFQPLGHGTEGIDLDALGLARAALHELDQRHVVDHRLGVGHAGDAGHPTRRRREAPGSDGLLVLVAGLAEVDVHVDEAGRQAVATAIDCRDSVRHTVGEKPRPEIGDRAVLCQ